MTLEYRDGPPPPEEARPMLNDGTVAWPWKWAIIVAIAAVALNTIYAVTTLRNEQHASGPPAASPAVTGSVPPTPLGGRATGDAPAASPVTKPGE